MPFDLTDPRYASPLASMTQDRMTGMLNQPQMKVFAENPMTDGGTVSTSPIMPSQTQLNRTMGMAKGGPVNDELANIKDQIRGEFAARGLDFDRFIQNPAVMDEVGRSMQEHGRGGDTLLAHINPKEAEVLKERGGAGTVNPHTGLLEFPNPGDIAGGGFGSGNVGGGSSPSGSSMDTSAGSGFDSSSWGGGGGSMLSSSTPSLSSTGGGNWSPSGSGGGGTRGSAATARALDRGSVAGYSADAGTGLQTTLSPVGAGNFSISMGQRDAQTAQATRPEPSVANYDFVSNPQAGGTGNLSGLGQLASTPTISPGLGAFAPTESAIASVPVSGSDTGLSNVVFNDFADQPAPTATPAAGNVSPSVTGYDPTNQTFMDANGNQFVVTPSGQRQYTAFSTTAPTPGQIIENVPGPTFQIPTPPPKSFTPIIASGAFEPKTQEAAPGSPTALQQAAKISEPVQQTKLTGFESALGSTPSMSSVVSELGSGNPASQMDAAMTIMGGGANMFGTQGDFVSSAINEANVSPSQETDIGLLNSILAGQSQQPQMAAAAPFNITPSNEPATIANMAGSPSISGIVPTRAEVPSFSTSPMTLAELNAMGIYKNPLAQDQTVRQNFNQAYADATKKQIGVFQWTNPATGKTSLYTSGFNAADLPAGNARAASGEQATQPAQSAAPTAYDQQVSALEQAGQIANGMTKEEYAAAMGVPVSDVQTRITTQFGPPMAEYYTKSLMDAAAGMTGDTGSLAAISNILGMTSPLGILGLGAKAAYNQYRKNNPDGGFLSPLTSIIGKN